VAQIVGTKMEIPSGAVLACGAATIRVSAQADEIAATACIRASPRGRGPYHWLRVGKSFFTFAELVGAAMCSAFKRGTQGRWP
jgi:hypothetical protein